MDLTTLVPRTVYYAFTGILSLVIFAAVMTANADVTGFLAFLLFWLKFVPLVLAGLSGIYYMLASKGGNDNTDDLGIGFKLGKTVYYAGVAAVVGLTFFITLIGGSTATGFTSYFHDILSVLAVVELALTWFNYQSYVNAPVAVVAPVVVVPPVPPAS
jgi:hypothetical protein